jgi:hypothetical protein
LRRGSAAGDIVSRFNFSVRDNGQFAIIGARPTGSEELDTGSLRRHGAGDESNFYSQNGNTIMYGIDYARPTSEPQKTPVPVVIKESYAQSLEDWIEL